MMARPIAFLSRDAHHGCRKSASRAAAIGALLCAMAASPAQSQPVGVRAASSARSSTNVVANAIQEASRRFHVPANWIRAVMRAESDGDDKSVSEKGAIGLMQVMPKTYAELQTKLGFGPDPFDPRDNILAGAAYLAELIEHYGETGFLAAYNAGPRRYEELLRRGRPLPVETTDYVARLAPELGFADNPAARIPAPFDALRSPVFVTLTTLKFAREATADCGVNSTSRSQKAAPHPLFQAQRNGEFLARDSHSDAATKAPLGAVSPRTANLFVDRPVSESAR